jgi:hypothetical protein
MSQIVLSESGKVIPENKQWWKFPPKFAKKKNKNDYPYTLVDIAKDDDPNGIICPYTGKRFTYKHIDMDSLDENIPLVLTGLYCNSSVFPIYVCFG